MKKLLAMVLALVMTLSLAVSANAAFKDADKVSADYSGRTEKFCIDADTRSAGSVRFNVVKNWYKVSVVVTVKETDGTCVSVQVKDFDVKAETEEIAKDIATADAVTSVADFAAAGCIIETEYCWAKKIMEGI